MGLQDKALKANGLSRACGKCKLGMRRCTPEIAEVCNNAFVEGYKKGYGQNKKDQEQKISSILHDARENVSGKNLFIFFRDVRGDEDAAFIERMKFINPKEQCIGTVRWRPKEEATHASCLSLGSARMICLISSDIISDSRSLKQSRFLWVGRHILRKSMMRTLKSIRI